MPFQVHTKVGDDVIIDIDVFYECISSDDIINDTDVYYECIPFVALHYGIFGMDIAPKYLDGYPIDFGMIYPQELAQTYLADLGTLKAATLGPCCVFHTSKMPRLGA